MSQQLSKVFILLSFVGPNYINLLDFKVYFFIFVRFPIVYSHILFLVNLIHFLDYDYHFIIILVIHILVIQFNFTSYTSILVEVLNIIALIVFKFVIKSIIIIKTTITIIIIQEIYFFIFLFIF